MNINDGITHIRNGLGLKVSYGLRAFAIYFLILGSLGWFLLDHAIERLNDGMRQAAENVMVDSVNLLAALIENDLTSEGELNTDSLSNVIENAKSRKLLANIYQVKKYKVSADIYVTNHRGIVVYDSTGENLGQDFSNWRDVNLSLGGRYGARTSLISREVDSDQRKAMVVGAPISHNAETRGVVSLSTPIESLEEHLATETKQMQRTMISALTVALFLGFLLSIWFSRSVNKIAVFADKMATGEAVEKPKLVDQRLADLANSVENLRTQLDGKEYVENYIHSLTHELKTPITGIQGAIELINEGLPKAEQELFLTNIRTSNQRMARLVEKMLHLAQLESKTIAIDQSKFKLAPMILRITNERKQALSDRQLSVNTDCEDGLMAIGDRVLISQAISNLIDNAISFSRHHSTLKIMVENVSEATKVCIINEGPSIPDFASERLYERFFSLPRKQNGGVETKSTGLGLSFVKEVMKLHNGTVDVKNHQNGVKAVLYWPSAQ
ncbi:two-component system sensor histidine kinase CreC [Arenicella sp. 4NH20-0111]|uniref:two-component system sensor histidine kinase CreC n=1 Tax=Arenicella sp. 4NH20-0111 TaxID=3127648 RepID=UPI003105A958